MALKWTVPELLQFKGEGLTLNETVDLTDISSADPEVRNISPVHVDGIVEFAKGSITFHLTVKGEMILPDSVTLEDVNYPFHIHTSETFLLNHSVEIEEADHEVVHDVEENMIDLIPFIKEAILVEKPIRIVSDRNNNPHYSGEGWDFVTEEERKNRIDPRLEKLKKFFDE
ncbi:YceD family protein [Scopulibacillus cellulosilyticus]|uniref:YceD family protein n=1 Tax=Scopulibacillus cellulosilyticus TaxID=2665665 RepID=A0ABW2PSV6_9BACL